MMSLKQFLDRADRGSNGKKISRVVLVCGLALVTGVAVGCRNDSGYQQQDGSYGERPSETSSPETDTTADAPPAPPTPQQQQQQQPPTPSLGEAPTQPPPGGNQPQQPQQPQAPAGNQLQPPPSLGGTSGEQSPMQEFQQAQMRLQEINSKLGQIEEQASDNAEVQEAREKLEAAALAKIEETTPGVQEDIDALQALGEKIQESGEVGPNAGQPSESTRADIEEFQQKRQELAQLEEQALQDPEVQALREDYEEKLMAALKEADPQAEELIEEREQLMTKLQSLQQQIMQQRMQQQMQQQGQQGQGQRLQPPGPPQTPVPPQTPQQPNLQPPEPEEDPQ